MKTIKYFFTTLLLFIIFDFLWLGFVVKDFNLRHLSEIGRIKDGDFDLGYLPATFAYLFMALAQTVFVRPKVLSATSVTKAFYYGALMGLIIYGVYDMTNLAILKNYPLIFSIADMAWGTFVFGLVSSLMYLRRF